MENLARQEEILDYVKTHKFASVALAFSCGRRGTTLVVDEELAKK